MPGPYIFPLFHMVAYLKCGLTSTFPFFGATHVQHGTIQLRPPVVVISISDASICPEVCLSYHGSSNIADRNGDNSKHRRNCDRKAIERFAWVCHTQGVPERETGNFQNISYPSPSVNAVSILSLDACALAIRRGCRYRDGVKTMRMRVVSRVPQKSGPKIQVTGLHNVQRFQGTRCLRDPVWNRSDIHTGARRRNASARGRCLVLLDGCRHTYRTRPRRPKQNALLGCSSR
jgi:hypothetical protein